MSAKFCCTCMHWEKNVLKRVSEEFGICHDVIATSKVMQDGENKLNEDSTLYTEAYYGCIYWRQHDGSVVNFRDVIDNKTGEVL